VALRRNPRRICQPNLPGGQRAAPLRGPAADRSQARSESFTTKAQRTQRRIEKLIKILLCVLCAFVVRSFGLSMILCVTLNPCLDKTLTVPAWRPGDSVRGLSIR